MVVRTEAKILRSGAADEVIANNPPILTKHTFPPIELDYDIIRSRRIMRRCVVVTPDLKETAWLVKA